MIRRFRQLGNTWKGDNEVTSSKKPKSLERRRNETDTRSNRQLPENRLQSLSNGGKSGKRSFHHSKLAPAVR